MPGLDHEVHHLVRQGAEATYGCSNRPTWGLGYYAPDREYINAGRYFEKQTFVQHRMSTECRYDMSLTDHKCRECKHRGSGEAYDQMIRSRGT